MKTCPNPRCRTALSEADRFCHHCGQPLDAQAPQDATVAIGPRNPPRAGPGGALAARVELQTLFQGKDRLVLGRAPDCDICLPHPRVSRYHAFLERLPDGSLRLRDLASVNGVWVNGVRLIEPMLVGPEQRVGIGPFLFTLANGVITTVDCSRSVRLEARKLEKVVRSKGETRKLLDNINLVVNPGEFVCLLGPSGSGKSTLMDALNGRRRATGGTVLANGEDFYRHFHNFRQSLGYVPQKDIVHTDLTVHKALDYTARLRLPKDTDPEELRARVERVLEEMELTEHRDKQIANLSGGQIKRVSLGAELLGQPCLLYIDEATSGLDAGTELRMMRLFRKLADEGRSVLCITHAVENVDKCHLILILAEGRMMYYGPPKEAPGFFEVDGISDIYDLFKDKSAVAVWETRFASSDSYEKYVVQRLEEPAQRTDPVRPVPARGAGPGDAEAARPEGGQPGDARADRAAVAAEEVKETSKAGERRLRWLRESLRLVSLSKLPPLADHIRQVTARYLDLQALVSPIAEFWHQFRVLLSRYLVLTLSDRRNLRLLLLQAPVVAIFLLLGFLDRQYQQELPLLRKMTDPEKAQLKALNALSVALDKEGPPEAALQDVRIRVQTQDGEEHEITGKELQQLADDLRDPEAALRRQRDEARVTLKGGNRELLQVTGKQLDDALQSLGEQDRWRKRLGYRTTQLSQNDRDWLKGLHTTVRVKDLEGKTRDHDLNGLELFESLDEREQLLEEWRRSNLKDVVIRVPVEAQVIQVTGTEMLQDLKEFHRSRVADRLLEMDKPIVPMEKKGVNPRFTFTVLFILVMIVLWFGCNNAAKEIVKEEAVYARERAVNLGIVPYLASKFLLLTLITAVHSLLLMGMLFGTMYAAHALLPGRFSVPFPAHLVSYEVMFGVFVLLSATGVAMGLVLSASVSSPDRASTLLPYVLIPQMILGGGFLAIPDGKLLYYVAGALSPAYWAYRAVHLGAHEAAFKEYPFYSDFADGVFWPCLALVAQTLVLLLLAAWCLRRKDVG